MNVWYGFSAPRGTPPKLVEEIASDVSGGRFGGLSVAACF